MKLKHYDLEACYSNTKAWVSNHIARKDPFFRLGYNRILHYGINHYHSFLDSDSTQNHMQKMIDNNDLIDISKIHDLFTRFNNYIDWHQKANVDVIDCLQNFELDLGYDITLSGQISRVDLTTQGYRGVFFQNYAQNWELELRMPLIQESLANKYQRSSSNFTVGFHDLDSMGIIEHHYNQQEIGTAIIKAKQLARRLKFELNSQSP